MKSTRIAVVLSILVIGLVAAPAIAPPVQATNGDNLIAIGPISRAMGGVGTAYPLDAIGAVFANSAAMCFGHYCPSSDVNFAGTAFIPNVEAEIITADGVYKDDSSSVYPIPAIGLSVPIGEGTTTKWRFGLAAYGVSGLGVDYKQGPLDQPNYYNFGGGNTAPLVAGEYTDLAIMKFSPALAFQALPNLSVGLGVHIDYASLDLREGKSSGFTLGLQPGIIYRPIDNLYLGLTYITPQSVTHDDVADFDGDGWLDDLDLEAPQQASFGAAYLFDTLNLLLEADVRWLNWSDADGYSDFDWDDQWVFAIGGQIEPLTDFFLRAGYNYGKNPVNEHSGWNGAMNPATGQPFSTQSVQGKVLPTYYCETFRVIGFPAIVEHHLTLGAGYRFTENFEVNLAWVHGFKNEIEESGTDLFGRPVTVKSTLSEDSIDFGLTWRF